MNHVNNLVIPEFSEYNLAPKNELCKVIDTTRLMVEILGWLKSASAELSQSEYAAKLDIDGDFSLVMRYKREKDGEYYPACMLSFDQDEAGNITINQLQGTKQKTVAYRFHSSFDHIEYFIKLIEESFIKKWIYVEVRDFPEWLEGASYSSKAYQSYNTLRETIKRLNKENSVSKRK